jgi:predicted nucleotidyltransferase
MEDIKDRLGEYKYNFFTDLQNYLNTELLFFGSIKRIDFFKNASDIDIIVITDNINSLLSKLQNYLNVSNSKIQKIYQQFTIYDKRIVTGYKFKYKEENNPDLVFDILIYDEKYRDVVMKNINDINNLPIYLVIILYIIKVLYYNLGLMTNNIYTTMKNFIFHCYFNKELKTYDKEHTTTIMLNTN